MNRLVTLAGAVLLLSVVLGCGSTPSEPTKIVTESGSVPSCYAISGLDIAPPVQARDVFVLVDQTTMIDSKIRETLTTNLKRLIQNGTGFTIATFSARDRDGYAKIVARGLVERTVTGPKQKSLPKRRLDKLDACLSQQTEFAGILAAQAMAKATSADAAAFTHSEILASLAVLSQAVKASPADDKIVLVVSDLFEHSTSTSFYAAQRLRRLDVGAELQKAADQSLIGDFGNARIYVVGAGLPPPDGPPDSLRDQEALNSLRQFWENWFRESHGDLREYGQPDLVNPII